MPSVRDTVASAVTDRTLVAAPGADRQIQINGFEASTTPANIVTLHSGGGDIIIRRDMAATTSVARQYDPASDVLCDPNEALTFTTTGAGVCWVEVDYSFVRARKGPFTQTITAALVTQGTTVFTPTQLNATVTAPLVTSTTTFPTHVFVGQVLIGAVVSSASTVFEPTTVSGTVTAPLVTIGAGVHAPASVT